MFFLYRLHNSGVLITVVPKYSLPLDFQTQRDEADSSPARHVTKIVYKSVCYETVLWTGPDHKPTNEIHPFGMLRNAIIWARPWHFLRISVISPTNQAQITVA